MKNLQSIEEKLLEDYNFKSFSEMGHGSFLRLAQTTKIKAVSL